MRTIALTLLFSASALLGCATAPAASHPAAAEKPAGPAPLTLTALTAGKNTPISFVLDAEGSLGPGVDGKEIQWSAKDDQGALGSGTVPVEITADRTFKVEIPISFAKSVAELDPYEKADDIEVTLETKVGDASGTRTVHMRSPHLPVPKILTVQATRSGPDTIELTYNFALDNSNNLYPLAMNGLDYKAMLGGKVVADNQVPVTGGLKQATQTEYTFNHQANEENCGKDIRTMAKQKTLTWGFSGVVHYPEIDVPFSLSGELQLAKE
jgi:hypothetical protein